MKEIAVALEHRFYSFQGALYTKLAFSYDYWRDYLCYFDNVKIIARVKIVDTLEADFVRVDGPQVEFVSFPYYVGPKQFLRLIPNLLLSSYRITKNHSHFLLRSGNITNLLWPFLIIMRRPYIREYPGNIKEGITGFAGHSRKMKFVAGISEYFAKIQAKFSRANGFVSEYCRKLYSSDKPSFVFSSFRLSEIKTRKISYASTEQCFRVISVGRLEKEKGHIDLVYAISSLIKNRNSNIQLHIIGDGSQLNILRTLATRLNVNILLHGAITDRHVLFDLLATADVFVIPSHTEGMPRALLEAMAIGLPCVGAAVGGIPEVLPQKFLFPPYDPNSLSKLLYDVLSDENLRISMGKQNLELMNSSFDTDAVNSRKLMFWSKLYE